jgi:hypothetical protein
VAKEGSQPSAFANNFPAEFVPYGVHGSLGGGPLGGIGIDEIGRIGLLW